MKEEDKIKICRQQECVGANKTRMTETCVTDNVTRWIPFEDENEKQEQVTMVLTFGSQ